ncbi:MAG: hypothetical protein PHP52_05100 [Bacteroidales bacterium]|nr:hypothetical protein [Bacteroidales bacterium]MDD4216347.1 hypothetical protein [Bacteroidales bacterium]MDY0140495.1 hypothetical protein [Bacteroidales bacterium]
MATIIIEYDARNKIAKKTIEYILSLGIFKVKRITGIDEALEDIKHGRVTKCKDFDDYLVKVG